MPRRSSPLPHRVRSTHTVQRLAIHSGNPHKDLIQMGTINSSETMSFAEYLRSQRTTTQAEVEARAEAHSAPVRYSGQHDRAAAAAH